MKRVRLSNREVRELREVLRHLAPLLEGVDSVEVIQISEKDFLYLLDGAPLLLKTSVRDLGEVVAPTLYAIHRSPRGKEVASLYPKAVVDAGAARRIVEGADVMRPGIRAFHGDFPRGGVVVVEDEKGRAIALAAAAVGRAEAEAMERGKVLLNFHHLGDRIWQACLDMAKQRQ